MHPNQQPVVYVQQPGSKASAVGIWILVGVFVLLPIGLVLLCCLGCFGSLGVGSAVLPFVDTTTPTPWPT